MVERVVILGLQFAQMSKSGLEELAVLVALFQVEIAFDTKMTLEES